MNTPKWFVSILMLVSVLLSACASPKATPIAITPPVDIATSASQASDPNPLAIVAGTYSYKVGATIHMFLYSDGTYASPGGFGTFIVAADQITFVDTLPASGTKCSSEPGIYKWSLNKDILTLVPVSDNCESRAKVFKGYTFQQVPKKTSEPVEFVWRITGAPNDFLRSTRVAVDGQSNIYIVDGGNQRIQKFDTNGKFLTMWGSQGDGDGQFEFRVQPSHFGAVAVDRAGNVYVTDYNSRVQKFDGNGKFLVKWGKIGSGDGQFASHSAMEIAVDTLGNVYVADTDNYRVQKFDSNGKFLLKWGSEGNGNGEFGSGNTTDGDGPAGIAVDSQCNVYILDTANYRIEKFDANGNFLSEWGSKGTGDGQFLNAGGIAVDQQDNVYITDNQQNVGGPVNQVSKFDSNGNFLLKWGGTGLDLGMLYYPGGVAVDKQGNLYVVSEENVQKFRPN